jgi:hypothetical protein
LELAKTTLTEKKYFGPNLLFLGKERHEIMPKYIKIDILPFIYPIKILMINGIQETHQSS